MAQFEMGATGAGTVSKREEAARAVCKLLNIDPELSVGPDKVAWMGHLQTVDAVIACIREPDEKMYGAPLEAMPEHANWLNARASFFVWQAMIDAIE